MSDADLYATVSDYCLLVEALDERRKELNISCNELDAVAAVAPGYSAKCFGGSQTKRFGWESVFKIARALGLRLVFEVDPAATAKTLATARRRHDRQARPGNFSAKCGKRGLDRALNYMARTFDWNQILQVVGDARAKLAAERQAAAEAAKAAHATAGRHNGKDTAERAAVPR